MTGYFIFASSSARMCLSMFFIIVLIAVNPLLKTLIIQCLDCSKGGKNRGEGQRRESLT